MDLQFIVENIEAMASIFSFDVLPDGSFSEIRIMAVNKPFSGLFALNPNAPEFTPGMPYRYFFQDVNFEAFCYKCGSTREALYSYVNAHGAWLSGLYIPIMSDKEGTCYCCYIIKFTPELRSEEMTQRSAEVSNAVLNISIKLHQKQDFIKSMSETVSDIKKVCNSEKCSIVLVDKNDQSCSFINENGEHEDYLRELASGMDRTPYEMATAWENVLAGTDCLLLDDFSIIKERDIKWYNSLQEKNIKSIVLFAIRFNEELVGFIWAANFAIEDMIKIKETLELTSYFIGAIIANHQLLGKLEVMSMNDMLTEVSNRNAMNKRVDQLIKGGSDKPSAMGVVFADLNGLKIVNDEQGHNAGDKLLRKAGLLLKTVFGDYEIYRAGGDEFVVLCPDIPESELINKTAEFKKLSDNTAGVSFAIGFGHFTGDYDIVQAMQIADERMYIDKEEYYRLNPDKKRRHDNNV